MIHSTSTHVPIKRRVDIQILRAIAVLLVVVFHYHEDAMPYGYLGVDLFFSISGFVVTQSILRRYHISYGHFDVAGFVKRRLKRLLLPLLAVCLLSLAIACMIYNPVFLKNAAFEALTASLSVSNIFYFYENDYFSPFSRFYLLLHTWSLSLEMQFYAVLALIFFLIPRRHIWQAVAIVSLLSLTLFLLQHFTHYGVFDDEAAFYLLPTRLWQLGGGCLAAFMVDAIQRDREQLAFWLYPLSLLCTCLLVLAIIFQWFSPALLTLVIGIVTLVLFVAGTRADMASNRVTLLWRALGDRSYALYLVHWPILLLFTHMQGPYLHRMIISLLVTLLLTELIFRMVERRTQRQSDRKWKGVAFASFVGISALSAAVIFSGGWPGRTEATEAAEMDVAPMVYQNDWRDVLRKAGDNVNVTTIVPEDRQFSQRVLVLGDSHASHLRHVGREILTEWPIEWTIYSASGCAPVFGHYKYFGVNQPRGSVVERICTHQIVLWEEELERHGESFDYVILASRWNWMFNDGPFNGRRVRRDRLLPTQVSGPVSELQSRAYFVEGLAATVERIRSFGPQVIVANQAPIATISHAFCTDRPFPALHEKLIDCDVYGYEDLKARGQFVDEVLHRLHESGSIYLLPLFDFLCSREDRSCPIVQEGHAFALDDDHIGPWGGKLAARRWMQSDYWPFAQLDTRRADP